MASKARIPAIVKNDPWLEPACQEIMDRQARYTQALDGITSQYGSLGSFADAYNFFGIHHDKQRKGWIYREWAPKAEDLYLFGDFNDWQRYTHRMTKSHEGIWEIFLPDDEYKDRLTHLSKIKVLVHSRQGWMERIPAYGSSVLSRTPAPRILPPRYGTRRGNSTGRATSR